MYIFIYRKEIKNNREDQETEHMHILQQGI